MAIEVVAALIVNPAGQLLMVRKVGTQRFMQPGGKPESGETPQQTICRELAEELALDIQPGQLQSLGRFTSMAANEPGEALIAQCFLIEVPFLDAVAHLEIAEARWFSPADAAKTPLAPLSDEVLLPIVWPQWRQGD